MGMDIVFHKTCNRCGVKATTVKPDSCVTFQGIPIFEHLEQTDEDDSSLPFNYLEGYSWYKWRDQQILICDACREILRSIMDKALEPEIFNPVPFLKEKDDA